MTIELKIAAVQEEIFYTALDGTLFICDAAVAQVVGEGGEIFSYTIRLDPDWRSRPGYTANCIEIATQHAFGNAIRAALA